MKDFKINETTKITLYLKECFGCAQNYKYAPLRQFILNHMIRLDDFMVKRIELNPDWQKEALAFGVELPFLVFNNTDGKRKVITYKRFLDWLDKGEPTTTTRHHSKNKESA